MADAHAQSRRNAFVQAQKGEEAARQELATQAELLSQTQTDLTKLQGDMEAVKGEVQSLKEQRTLSEEAWQAAEDTLATMEHLQRDLQTKSAECDQLLASHKADQVANDKAIEALQTALKEEQQLRHQAEKAAGSQKGSGATRTLVAENSALQASMRRMEAVGNAQLNEFRAANAKLLVDLAQARRHSPHMHPTAGCPTVGPMFPAASYPPIVPMHPANMALCYPGAPISMGYSPVSSPIGAYTVMTPFNQRPNNSLVSPNHATNKTMLPPNGNHRPSVGKFSHNRPHKATFPQRR